jgi:hypothetical protein
MQRTRVEASITLAGLEAAAIAKNDAEIANLYAAAAEKNYRAAESIEKMHELNELEQRLIEEQNEVLAEMARPRERSLERDEEEELDISEEKLILAEEEVLDDGASMEDADEAKV